MATNRLKTFVLSGGEDLTTAPIDMVDGVARVAYNYEQNYNTGFTRIAGYRDLVSTGTPGEGSILGTIVYNNNIYIFQNKIGGVTAGFWKAIPDVYDETATPSTTLTVGSWVEIVDIKDELGVVTTLKPDGFYDFVINNFKATVRGFGTYRGDWEVKTNYLRGDIIVDAVGDLGPIDAVYITDTTHTSDKTTIADDASFWSVQNWTADIPDQDSHNIIGTPGNLYGVDGKNPAFEFDGTTLTQIDSGYDNDTPSHITANGNRLALGFRSGEVALSVLGSPTDFDAIKGAGSFGVEDFLTGLEPGPDGIMYVYAKQSIYIMKGMSGPLSESTVKKHNKEIGAYPYTQQQLSGYTLFYDTWGITSLEITQRFGDVISSVLSSKIQDVLLGSQPQTSVVLKEKAQYRLYFKRKQGTIKDTVCILGTIIEGESIGFTHASYPFDISTSISGELTDPTNILNNKEVHIVGTTTGNVYEMDVSTSFNGAEYNSFLTLPFNYLGSPHRVKKFRKIMTNIEAKDEVNLIGSVDFSFGTNDQPKELFNDIVNPVGGIWGGSSVWGDFNWGAGIYDYVEAYINGHGENISVTFSSTSSTDRPHTLKDITFVYQYQRIDH